MVHLAKGRKHESIETCVIERQLKAGFVSLWSPHASSEDQQEVLPILKPSRHSHSPKLKHRVSYQRFKRMMLQANKRDAPSLAFGSARVKNNKPNNERRAEDLGSVNVEARRLKPSLNGSPDSVKSQGGGRREVSGAHQGISERFCCCCQCLKASTADAGNIAAVNMQIWTTVLRLAACQMRWFPAARFSYLLQERCCEPLTIIQIYWIFFIHLCAFLIEFFGNLFVIAIKVMQKRCGMPKAHERQIRYPSPTRLLRLQRVQT